MEISNSVSGDETIVSVEGGDPNDKKSADFELRVYFLTLSQLGIYLAFEL